MSQKSDTEYKLDDIPKSNELSIGNLVKKNQKIIRILVKATKKAKDNCFGIVEVKGDFSNEEIKLMASIMKERGYGMWKSSEGWTFSPSSYKSKFDYNGGFDFGKSPLFEHQKSNSSGFNF